MLFLDLHASYRFPYSLQVGNVVNGILQHPKFVQESHIGCIRKKQSFLILSAFLRLD